MPSVELASKRQAAREVIDILSEISLLLVRVNFFTLASIPNVTTEYASRSQHFIPLCLVDRE